MTFDFYSFTLGLAILAAASALGLALAGWYRSRVRREAGIAGAVALVLAAISGVGHVYTGHRPGSPTSLSPSAFLGEHPALLTAAAMAVAAFVVLRIASKRLT